MTTKGIIDTHLQSISYISEVRSLHKAKKDT